MNEEKNLEEIGIVVDFYARPQAAAIQFNSGSIKVGDNILIQGHTTHLEQVIESLEINNQKAGEAKAGDIIGIKVQDRVRKHDKVLKVT